MTEKTKTIEDHYIQFPFLKDIEPTKLLLIALAFVHMTLIQESDFMEALMSIASDGKFKKPIKEELL